MSSPKDRLKKIEFSRSYKSENDSEIHLIGQSRWIRDVELLLEEKWRNLKCYHDQSEAFGAITSDHPRLALIELKAHGDDTSRWIEACVQNNVQGLVISPDNANQFEWMSAARKAAAHNFGSVLFSSDSRSAADEISNFLDTSDALTSTKSLSDVNIVQYAQAGFKIGALESEDLVKEMFSLISDEFILPSDDLAKGLALVGSIDLWKKPKPTDSELYAAYFRIERDLKEKEVYRLITSAIAAVDAYRSNALSEERWDQILSESKFGLLSKRKLRTKFNEAVILLQSASGQRILRIA